MDNSNQWRKRMARGVMTLMFAAVPMQGMFAQVTLNTPNTTLGVVIKKIQAQSEFKFFYDDDLSDMRVKAINVKDAALEKVLAQLLKDKGVTFKVDDKVVYLKRAQLPRQQTRRGGEKRKITGRILDENGEPLIGASVTIKGTTDRAVTDMDGNYTVMTDAENPVAQFTYLGYKPQEIMAGKNSVVNAMMVLDSQSIDEVVVTALGIKREKKMLGYSVQDIKSDALNTTGDPSVTGALEGKVAGLQMNTASTGLGGSTKITIRGNSSLTDNNQPLWIVDGVPFTDDQTSDASAYGGYDRGGTSFDINPEDIESVSVLKGPNAAALYGSRAGNGVILVTTKKGSHKQGFGISYSGNFTWSEAAETIRMQKKYGQGSNGKTVYIYDDENNPTALTGELSFGPALDGHLEPSWLGEKIPYKYYGDKLKDYFKTGFSQFHTVALGNTTEKSHFRVSVGFNGNNGLFKDETLDKLTTDLNAGAVINDRMSLDGKISLSHMKAENRPYTGLNGEVAQLLLIPGNVRLGDLAPNYTSAERLHQNWFGPDQQYSNPYYVRHRFRNSDERWRVFGYYSANLNLTDWLKFNAKYSFDYYRTRIQTSDLGLGDQAISTPEQSWQDMLTNDNMQRGEENHFEHNIQFLFMGDTPITPKLRLGYTVGSNIMYLNYEMLNVGVENMLDKDNWIFNTGYRLVSGGNDGHKRAMYSVFGSAQIAYDEYLSRPHGAQRLVVHTAGKEQLVLLSVGKRELCVLRLHALHRQTAAQVGHVHKAAPVCRTGG